MPSNESFDLEYWCNKFPATEIERRHRENPRKDWEDKHNRVWTATPYSVAHNTHCRAALWPDLDPATGTATDVFAWAIDESENRAATKIGGLPYLPTTVPWPTTSEGKAKEFVAQFNLADSQDLLPALPGDLLLIFCEACDEYERYVKLQKRRNKPIKRERPEVKGPVKYGWLDDAWEFLFVDTSVHGPGTLISRDALPDVKSFLRPLHGQRFRSSDHPELDDAYCEKEEKAEHPWLYTVSPPGCWWGTKIGGAPTWEQENAFTPWGKEAGKPGGPAIIGQLNSPKSDLRSPFPYVGREEPFEDHYEEFRYHSLIIADAGTLHLFWDGENVLYEIQA